VNCGSDAQRGLYVVTQVGKVTRTSFGDVALIRGARRDERGHVGEQETVLVIGICLPKNLLDSIREGPHWEEAHLESESTFAFSYHSGDKRRAHGRIVWDRSSDTISVEGQLHVREKASVLLFEIGESGEVKAFQGGMPKVVNVHNSGAVDLLRVAFPEKPCLK